MNGIEAIEQLESLKNHSEDMEDTKDPECIYSKDIAAINIGISAIKKTLRDCNPIKAKEK